MERGFVLADGPCDLHLPLLELEQVSLVAGIKIEEQHVDSILP